MPETLPCVLVSSCLLGEAVRYDGGDKRCDHAILQRWLLEGRVVPVCPEMAAGMSVPRPPAEITEGAGGLKVFAGEARVIEADGNDVSVPYMKGARLALEMARARGLRVAVLKEGSPSCGMESIHDGSFTDRKVANPGVTAAFLQAAGIRVFSENRLDEADCFLRQLEAGAV